MELIHFLEHVINASSFVLLAQRSNRAIILHLHCYRLLWDGNNFLLEFSHVLRQTT